MSIMTKLPNIGPKLDKQLLHVDIATPEKLRKVGSRETWLRIPGIDPSACIMRLYGLEGAILGMCWHDRDSEIKMELKGFYQNHK
ncbi:hypothetical protein SDC9_159725 [bioreactor metagenome]|uniref:TfoX C-terminal domain-containing protein n=1 Tax=bioreactor metagenome TaxID=1076179 RepID=A0A645FDM4_9ZZZZ